MPFDITLSDFTPVASPRHERLPAYRFTVTVADGPSVVSWVGNLLVYDPATDALRVQPPRASYGRRPYIVRISEPVYREILEAAADSEFGHLLIDICRKQVRTLQVVQPIAKVRLPAQPRNDFLIDNEDGQSPSSTADRGVPE